MKSILGMTLVLLCVGTSAQSRLNPLGGQRNTSAACGNHWHASGVSVAISGNTLVIGAPEASDNTCGTCGAVFVYTAVDGDWTNLVQVATLRQSSGQTETGGFGSPVAISGDTIVVGGYNAQTEQSAAYVYVNPSGDVTQTAELTLAGVDGGIYSIAIDGGTIVLGDADFYGAPYAAAFVYIEPSTGWADMTQTAELVSKDVDGDDFGLSVAVSGRNIVVGALSTKIDGVRQGVARAEQAVKLSLITVLLTFFYFPMFLGGIWAGHRIHGQQSRAVQIAVEMIYRTLERNWLAPDAI